MTVSELIAILKQLDPDLPVATGANNHEYFSSKLADGYSHGPLRVVLARHYSGQHVLIGNISRKNLNGNNWGVLKELDGLDTLPENW